ncbi:Uncharacterised protein [Escherichia coli]|nr:hypothetical protein [Escherichia coli]EGF2686292.1 hypothetical protein [Shigella sonnei]EEW1963119.1 hypothetical protein [Escherichia coli]EEW2314231.1 hypothetical protein [Escherichia coli]EFB6598575.1 hypothetical protein [Escherichia coli]
MFTRKKVVNLVVLTISIFCFSFPISQLMATAIPVRGAKFKKACFLAGFLLSKYQLFGHSRSACRVNIVALLSPSSDINCRTIAS